jgi:hypothetical protein
MGQLKEKHGLTMFGATPPDTCPECAVKHEPDEPHNQQYKYYVPTWADAMAHCTPDVKELWREALAEHGIEVNPESGVAIEEIEITIEISKEVTGE